MSIVLLLIIYLIFISLGLPDSLIGASWPALSQSLEISESMQGVLTLIIAFCTVISSFLTIKLVKYLRVKGVVILSILLTALGLVCISYSPSFLYLCLSAIPLGLGAGAIDSTLNNYVALHYKAIHLNWLHAFWGVGAMISPLIVGVFLTDLNGWRKGALCLAIIQFSICLVTILTSPIWSLAQKDFDKRKPIEQEKESTVTLGFFKSFTIKGVMFAIVAFFSYIAIEQLCGLWFSSMVVFNLGVKESDAANWVSLFYLGIMIGRFVSGIVSLKVKDKNMIRIGEGILVVGIILMMFYFYIPILPVGLFLVGLGCAPIYPAIIHATPDRFTKELSQNVMSIQVGCAYIANISIAPLFGIIGKATTFLSLPYLLLFFLVILTIGNEIVLVKTKDKTKLLKTKQKEIN